MSILIDYSHLAIHHILTFQKDLEKVNYEQNDVLHIARHSILSGIKHIKTKFPNYNDEIILAIDGDNYWRKTVFPYYKSARKKNREASSINWKMIFDARDTVLSELYQSFPYKVIKVDHAEGDDVIAILTKWLYTNKVTNKGLFAEPDPVLIVSRDKDLLQLQSYSNVKQWNIATKEYLYRLNLKELNSHIAGGDVGDNIPNVLSDDDSIINPDKRQKRMMAKRLAEFTEHGREACLNDTEKRNWDRNNTLINFSQIPADLETKIIAKYESTSTVRDLNVIMNYLITHRCSQLLSSIEDF